MRKIWYLLSIGYIFLLTGCSTSKNTSKSTPFDNKLDLTIVQNGTSTSIKNSYTSIPLKKIKFSLEFNLFPYVENDKNAWHAIHVGAVTKKGNLKYLNEGKLTDKNPFFSPTGTAYAASGIYDHLYINDECCCHYVYYASDTDSRATVIRKNSDGSLRLRWDISSFSYHGDTTSTNIAKINNQTLYLMILNDMNHNDVIESGEHAIVEVKFE